MPRVQRALLSVTDKTGLAAFAGGLHDLGVELISTGGTAALLRKEGIPVRDVSEVTGFPEMLDGRVKTIHPMVAGGVLAIRSNPEHMAAVQAHGICLIDMVVVNLYEFEKVAARKDAPLHELIENIDIGGPTMIRAAAKNWQDVAVVVSPADYDAIFAELKASEGTLRPPPMIAPSATGSADQPSTSGMVRTRISRRPCTRTARVASLGPSNCTERSCRTTTSWILMPRGNSFKSSIGLPPRSSNTPTRAAAPSRRLWRKRTEKPSKRTQFRPLGAY